MDKDTLEKYGTPVMNKMAKSLIGNHREAVEILKAIMLDRGLTEVATKTV